MKTLPLDRIRLDGGTQARVALDESYIAELAESADKLPPVDVFFDGSEHWLADGFNRWHARNKANKSTIPVLLHQGAREDAVVFAAGANVAHGQRRSNEDKRHAVEMLLALKGWVKKSNVMVAEAAGVTDKLVADVRVNLGMSEVDREGRDGKTRKMPAKRAPEPLAEPADELPMADDAPPAPPAPPASPPDPLALIMDRANEIQAMMNLISEVRCEVEAKMGVGDELFSELTLSQFQADCNNAYRALRFAKPYKVCPYCGERGHGDCKACNGRGWLGEGKWNAVPEELRK